MIRRTFFYFLCSFHCFPCTLKHSKPKLSKTPCQNLAIMIAVHISSCILIPTKYLYIFNELNNGDDMGQKHICALHTERMYKYFTPRLQPPYNFHHQLPAITYTQTKAMRVQNIRVERESKQREIIVISKQQFVDSILFRKICKL